MAVIERPLAETQRSPPPPELYSSSEMSREALLECNSGGVSVGGCYTAERPVMGGRSASVTMPGAAATTAGTALVTGIAV